MFSLTVTLIAGVAFILFDITWIRRDGERNLTAYEEVLFRTKEANLRNLVSLVVQSIDIERERARREFEGIEADRVAKERITDFLRKVRTENNGYFWINEVIDYGGGPNYARRLVHPNLPETEGMLLSTELRDAEGRLPYKEELEGIKKDGELLFTYTFKKPGQDEVGLKLSYARLYGDFNWIIATGVYLDDVEALVSRERLGLEDRIWRQFLSLVGFTLLVLGVSSTIIVIAARMYYFKLAELAERDALTGLYNRRAGQDRLEQELSRSRRNGTPFCILLGDLDYFKSVNDSHGHAAGDAVLKVVAGILSRESRTEDMAIRWGGEEFLLILGGADAVAGAATAERIRERIEAARIPWEGRGLSLSITIGVAACRPGESSHDLVRRADDALYRGKEAGRNVVAVDPDDAALSPRGASC